MIHISYVAFLRIYLPSTDIKTPILWQNRCMHHLEPPFARRCVLEFAKVSSTPMAMTCAGNYQTGLPNQFSKTTTCNLKVFNSWICPKKVGLKHSEEYPFEWASEIVLASSEKKVGVCCLFKVVVAALNSPQNFLHFHILVKRWWAHVSAGNGKQPNCPDHHESNSLTANESGAATAPSPIENAQHIYNYNTNSPTWNKNAHLPKRMESFRIHALMFFWHLVFAFIH